jgi:hypothetical protein
MSSSKNRQTKRQAKPSPADFAAFIAMCINVTANTARDWEEWSCQPGQIDPQLYPSLKALQLQFDIAHRRLMKAGDATTIPWSDIASKLD